MSIRKNWNIKNTVIDDSIIQLCDGNRVLAALLSNRGINTKEKIYDFLNPLKAKMSSPDVFVDMQIAFERLKQAIDRNEHITVYGDFDADGITSTALLYLTLKEIGADVDYYLPDRSTESHGLNTKALVNLIAKKKTKLIITVDCGISNVQEVAFAKGFKTDVIITDHHEAPSVLPDAFAILNPKAPNSINQNLDINEIQSLNYLAGVGVAFIFACKILKEFSKENFVYEILPLAAVGTIGDVVELIGENRTIVSMGLELIRKGGNKAITKILTSSEINDISTVTSENIAFYVVPRLNAAGRLESPQSAIKLLTSKEDNEINELVRHLNDLNILRQNLCDEAYKTAEEMYLKNISSNKQCIVLFNENWHIGIIGIVASKLVEKYNRPVFLMTRDTNFPNIIRCSCRSIQEINIHEVLSNHKENFEGFGGHKMAAGFSFDENKIKFDKFKQILSQSILEVSQNIDFSQTSVDVDMFLEPNDITIDTVKLIDKLQPFGSGNPSPLFAMESVVLDNFRMMGQENNHLKMFVSKDNSSILECIKWNYPDFNIPLNSKLDILFSLKINNFNDKSTVQLMVEDIHSEFLNKKNIASDIKVLDHRNKKNIINQVFDFVASSKKKTGIFIENPALIKQLKIPEQISNKLFSRSEIPTDIEQLMFFDIPATSDEFSLIINNTGASLVHLMNFDISELNIDTFITRLSGMLKYSLSNLSGELNIERLSKAFGVENDVIECALTLFDEVSMINLNKTGENIYYINQLHPIELSKIKESPMYLELSDLIDKINNFRNFYLTSSVNDIKEMCMM